MKWIYERIAYLLSIFISFKWNFARAPAKGKQEYKALQQNK